jgi:hypothetical protein
MPRVKRSYTPAPALPPELMQRLALIVEVLAGIKTVSEAARTLGISRNHFQTILHRGVTGLMDAIAPKAAGRPGKPPALAALEARTHSCRSGWTRPSGCWRWRAGSCTDASDPRGVSRARRGQSRARMMATSTTIRRRR